MALVWDVETILGTQGPFLITSEFAFQGTEGVGSLTSHQVGHDCV